MAQGTNNGTRRRPALRRSDARSYQEQRRRRRSRALLAQSCLGVLIVALLFGISYTSVKLLHGQAVWPALAVWVAGAGETPSLPAQSDAPPDVSDSAAPDPADAPEALPPDTVGEQPWNVNRPLAERAPYTGDARMLSVPENGRLGNEYFRTVMFVGDSLSQGFALYAPTKDIATVCAYRSTGPQQVLQNYVGQRPDGTRIEMWDDINIRTPSAIYLLFGTNALLQQSDDAFLKYYGDLMDRLHERFAGVPIYVQSITPTTAAQGVKQPPLENGHIRAVNERIAQLARGKGLYYINAQEVLCDADGNLRADYVGTYDGIHMNPTGYAAWADYLLTHTVYSAENAAFLAEGPYT